MPDSQNQIVPKPPTYEEILKDLSEGKKQIYVDPQYLPEESQEMPPEYEDEEIHYALDEEDDVNQILDVFGLPNYDDVEKQLHCKSARYDSNIQKEIFERNEIN